MTAGKLRSGVTSIISSLLTVMCLRQQVVQISSVRERRKMYAGNNALMASRSA
jgi:hypothetical protein